MQKKSYKILSLILAFLILSPYFALLNVQASTKYQNITNSFQCPYGVALDGSGNLFVVENIGCKVQKFDSSRNVVTAWNDAVLSSISPTTYRFGNLDKVEVDSTGNVYITDTLQYTILKIDGKTGDFSVFKNFSIGESCTPIGIAIDTDDSVYVANELNGHILKFNSWGKEDSSWSSKISGMETLIQPEAIALDKSTGYMYVADAGSNSILKFNKNGGTVQTIATQGSGAAQVSSPHGITVDADGNIYVADTGNNRVQELNSNGGFIRQWGNGTWGTSDSVFNIPTDVAVDLGGNLYVADSGNNRVVNISPDNSTPITAKISSVTTTNGTVKIVLDKIPTAAPVAGDFTAASKIDSGTETNLPMSNFDWNKATKTVTFSFTPIAQKASAQCVTVAVSYKDAPLVSAATFTVDATAGGETPSQTITGFLLDYTEKTVPYGTNFSFLNLPDKIKATGKEISNLWVSVSDWVCSSFKPTVPGTYTFNAVLDSGYVLDNSVSAPEIKVTVKENTSSSNKGSSKKSPSSSSTTNTNQTETKVDTAGNTTTVTTKPDSVSTSGNITSIETTVPSVTVDNTSTSTNGSTVDTAKKAVVTIHMPTEAIVQQLTEKKNVDLTVTVPSEVAKDAVGGAVVTINASKEILEAAKENLTDVTIKIKDADTQQLAYSWMFKGADLAKSTVPVKDVNIAMSVHLTTEVSKVNAVTPSNRGLVLSFDHSGELPSVAGVKFSAREKGFQPGQTLYFYYYNPTTRQIESLGTYVVDADGNVTVQISHCSNYVLLPKAARSIMLDTRTYTISPKKSYEIGVKLTGAPDSTIKAYSSTKGVANVTVLKNGNVRATGIKPGLTYVMIDVYDNKNKLLTHASVKLTVQNGAKETGNSARQYGIF